MGQEGGQERDALGGQREVLRRDGLQPRQLHRPRPQHQLTRTDVVELQQVQQALDYVEPEGRQLGDAGDVVGDHLDQRREHSDRKELVAVQADVLRRPGLALHLHPQLDSVLPAPSSWPRARVHHGLNLHRYVHLHPALLVQQRVELAGVGFVQNLQEALCLRMQPCPQHVLLVAGAAEPLGGGDELDGGIEQGGELSQVPMDCLLLPHGDEPPASLVPSVADVV
mmetsp:Transcript_52295/g.162348  ORF Transcript_52295/g.162348 Transcript_52295/m.162348 type:complete len:225 (+) Transcript_52295:609-1283(+)